MSFHEDFWLAVSAVAPVITLATVVAAPEAAATAFRAGDALRAVLSRLIYTEVSHAYTPDENAVQDLRWAARATHRLLLLCYANLVVQAVLLAVSLTALASGRDVVPPWLAIVVAVGGVGLLAVTLVVGVVHRPWVEQAIRQLPPPDGPPARIPHGGR